MIRASAADLLWICISFFALGAIFGAWIGAYLESLHWAKAMIEQTRQVAPIIAGYADREDSEFHAFVDDDARADFDARR